MGSFRNGGYLLIFKIMIKYPSIEQFRNVIRAVKSRHDFKGKTEDGEALYFHDTPYPKLMFQGTVKIHGTNAGIVKYKDPSGFTDIEFQSRERVLSIGSDNAGFTLAMSGKNLDFLFEGIDFKEHIAVYGEWCGGNIQKGVAVCQLPKMFVIFGCMVDGVWKDKEHIRFDNEQGIYNIHQFPRYDVEIDFNNPEAVQNTLIELTLAVEEKCPVGYYFLSQLIENKKFNLANFNELPPLLIDKVSDVLNNLKLQGISNPEITLTI